MASRSDPAEIPTICQHPPCSEASTIRIDAFTGPSEVIAVPVASAETRLLHREVDGLTPERPIAFREDEAVRETALSGSVHWPCIPTKPI